MTCVTERTEDKERREQRADACFEAEEPDIRPTRAQVLGALDALVDDTGIIVSAAGSLPGDLRELRRARSRDQYRPGVRLRVHGPRDPGRDRGQAGRPRPARCGRRWVRGRT